MNRHPHYRTLRLAGHSPGKALELDLCARSDAACRDYAAQRNAREQARYSRERGLAGRNQARTCFPPEEVTPAELRYRAIAAVSRARRVRQGR